MVSGVQVIRQGTLTKVDVARSGRFEASETPGTQALIGNILDRCITDAGYRGHNAPPDHKFKVVFDQLMNIYFYELFEQ